MSNHILIIEDDAAIAQVLRLNLECADYNVTGFDNGLSACDALAKDHDYDLALLDMMLPGMDGFALLPKLREWGIPVMESFVPEKEKYEYLEEAASHLMQVLNAPECIMG